jgi:hypothetical protein
VLDTVRIARRRFGRGGNGLQALARRFGIVIETAHRALADVRTTIGVMQTLLEPQGAWNVPLCDALLAQGGKMGLLPANPRESLLPLELEEALELRKPVMMEYLDAREARTHRVIEPRFIRRVAGELMLVAHCQLRQAQRTFKLERIVQLTRIEEGTAAPPVTESVTTPPAQCEAPAPAEFQIPIEPSGPAPEKRVESTEAEFQPAVADAASSFPSTRLDGSCYDSGMLATAAETAILKRVIRPDVGDVPPEAARALLAMGFDESDHTRMAELSAKAAEGTLTPEEQNELDGYINVSHFIAFIQSKARVSLSNQNQGPKSSVG